MKCMRIASKCCASPAQRALERDARVRGLRGLGEASGHRREVLLGLQYGNVRVGGMRVDKAPSSVRKSVFEDSGLATK